MEEGIYHDVETHHNMLLYFRTKGVVMLMYIT